MIPSSLRHQPVTTLGSQLTLHMREVQQKVLTLLLDRKEEVYSSAPWMQNMLELFPNFQVELI